MIVEFSVANFKSIRTKQTLSMMAAAIVSKEPQVDENNVFTSPTGVQLLKSAGIYGANASGKSNVVKALLRMLHFIEKSFQNEEEVNQFECFQLDRTCTKEPIHFELVFITGGHPYRYGFEITGGKVSAEWLFGPANKSEVEYFTRLGDRISVNKTRFKEGIGIDEGKTRSSTLFLNVAHAFNGPVSKEIKTFFRSSIVVASGLYDSAMLKLTADLMEDADFKEKIVHLLRSADTGIDDLDNVELEELKVAGTQSPPIDKRDEKEKNSRMLGSIRKVKNAEDPLPFFFRFETFESEGTKKLFAYAGSIIGALQGGWTLVIDELDARLHPTLTRKIVEIFNSIELNPNNAQLIFVTHDVNLMDPSLLRRDQIYFTEKNLDGETSLFSLVNIGGVRNDVSYEREYMKGKYGALPYLGEFKFD